MSVDLSSPPLQQSSVEDAPGSSSILQPLLDLIPSISGFQMPAHDSICYAPTFEIAWYSFVIDAPCLLIDPHRELIGLVSLVMWSISAFYIIMGA